MADLCFVVTCMGRLSFLQQTLGRLCAQPGCACVVVDYSCPDQSGDWVEANHPQARVVRCAGHTAFNLSAARNAGARAAGAPWLCFIDADILAEPDFSATLLPLLRPGHYYRADTSAEGMLGTLVCARADFERTGGCDEVYQNWGEEDNDLCDALAFVGVLRAWFPARLLQHLPHGNELRSQFYAIADLSLSMTVNRVYRLLKWDLALLTGNPPAPDVRPQLYGAVLERVRSVLQDGRNETLEVQFNVATVAGRFWLDRHLTYNLRAGREP